MYEGTRTATEGDIAGIKLLLKPLEDSGALVRRTDEEVFLMIDSFIKLILEVHISFDILCS
jgi:amino-acid N-acetyltransferase